MGYGKTDMSGKHNIPGLGKYSDDSMPAHGAVVGKGVKVDKNNISNSQKQVLAGAYNSFGQAKVISGGHPKGGFMHKSKSMGNPKDGDMKGDQSNTKKDYSMDKGNTDPNYKSKKDGESKGDQSASDKDYSTPKYPKKGVPKSEKLPMVEKDGKKVPFYAADGKGKM